MNKPLLLILVLIAGGLLVYLMAREEPDTTPKMDVATEHATDGFLDLKGAGVKTDEEPNFEVAVEVAKSGQQQILKFEVTETHGWGVTGVYVAAYHRKLNEETGEWERDPKRRIVQLLIPAPLEFGETLEASTTLTNIELELLDGSVGKSEEWEAVIYQTMGVYKPKK